MVGRSDGRMVETIVKQGLFKKQEGVPEGPQQKQWHDLILFKSSFLACPEETCCLAQIRALFMTLAIMVEQQWSSMDHRPWFVDHGP